MGSSIDLGDAGSDVAGGSQAMASGELSSSEDFLLTPIAEDDGEDDEDSSQIISLDAVEEGESEAAILGGGLEIGSVEGGSLEATEAAPAAVAEADFSVWNVVGLGTVVSAMTFCGVMMVDVVRNIWSWNEPTGATSGMIDGLLSIFGR